MIADGEPSFTAFTAAAARAAHLIVDAAPVIFADTLAGAMLGERADEYLEYHRAHGTHPILAGARAQATCRSRYAEDRLADAIGRGIGQYVLLGAGLDSFASRSPLAARVRVFETDHPATQEWKRRVRPVPDGVTLVPVDFSRDSLRDRLGRAGFDFAQPAFVSWLGVTMYLPGSAIEQALSVAGGFAPGSEIVVDYMLPAGWRDEAGDYYAEQIGPASAERGEPWLSLLVPQDMAAMLRRHGFGRVRDVRQRDMIPAAAWDRTDSLRPADLSRIAHGRIADGPSRWPTTGSAPAWAPRSRTAGSSSPAGPTGSSTTCPGTSSTTRRPGRSSTCSPSTASPGSTTTTCGTPACCCGGCSAAAG